MKRQINNLLFLLCFMLALIIGRTDYIHFGKSLLTNVYTKAITVSKHHYVGKQLAKQDNYRGALPSEVYVEARQSFMEGKYFNKSFIEQRVVGGLINSAGAIITATTNHGRDGP
jgi:hypothetical protein